MTNEINEELTLIREANKALIRKRANLLIDLNQITSSQISNHRQLMVIKAKYDSIINDMFTSKTIPSPLVWIDSRTLLHTKRTLMKLNEILREKEKEISNQIIKLEHEEYDLFKRLENLIDRTHYQ